MLRAESRNMPFQHLYGHGIYTLEKGGTCLLVILREQHLLVT